MLVEWPVLHLKSDESLRASTQALALVWQVLVSRLSAGRPRSFSVPPVSDAWLLMHEAESDKRGHER
jgi:hypothetical protein